MKPLNIPLWRTAPFVRLLAPFIIGIVLQWYLSFPLLPVSIIAVVTGAAFISFSFLKPSVKFRWQFIQGILLQLLICMAGILLTWNKDVRHQQSWYGNTYIEGDYIVAVINEPLTEKTKSYKAQATICQLVRNDSVIMAGGNLLIYFSKDSAAPPLQYGDKILINKKLTAIKNSGNPGAFNYRQYAAFQQLFHNVFLKPGEWVKCGGNSANGFQHFLFSARDRILVSLQKNITQGNAGTFKDELGIAEALLIGYTNDLDKDLVQAYSNTGVVHIIAISGMHLGLIYGMLLWLCTRLPLINKSKTSQAILILGCLWLFSLLTGGSASVIRSAVMFTFITLGTFYFKKTSLFNSLAASAFVMLVYNPYYLWDVGFQLSYLAVTGIVVFQKPLYNLFYIQNKWLDQLWKAAALTTAAQILTFPVCIYYFHQFPVLFLFTNLIAVPLSTIILYVAILLVSFSWMPVVAGYIGTLTGWLLWVMNKIILWVNGLPFAIWDQLPATLFTTGLLYAMVISMAAWLMNRNKKILLWSLACCAGFVLAHTITAWHTKNQLKFIVYNVPQHQAIDFAEGNNYRFVGDSVLLEDGVLQNFHIKPARIAMQINKKWEHIPACFNKNEFYQFGNKKIVVIDKSLRFEAARKIEVDFIVVSKNALIDISQITKTFDCSKFIFDASNSLWKIEKWKQDCDKLHLRYHSIPDEGALVVDL